MEGVVLSPFYLFYLNITCSLSWKQLLKERAANRGTLFPVFFLRHYFILPFEEGFVSFHFDAKQLYSGKTSCFQRSDILGTIAPEKLPEWAKHYLEIVRQAEKKSRDREGR